ncbi:MAG: T9SS type A sorting domain-containing protein, partial [candidate division KSB1 bacterium]|nr:T9SS type A sorting domain-containing protein [candidate division KSB1 bacterium]
ELAWDIVETADNHFVICGYTLGKSIWDLDGWIINIDSSGELVWTKQIGSQGIGAGTDFLTCIILNNQNELVLTGNRYTFRYGKQVWFLKINTNGEVLTEKLIGGKAEDNGHKIIQNHDGSYMIIGDTESFGTQNGGKDIWLLKLNSQGDTLWTRTYDLGAADMATGIIPFRNNQFLIAAVSCTDDCGGMFQQGFATYFVIDSVGNTLKSINFAEGPKNKFSDTYPTADGGAIITGATSRNDKFPSEDIWLVKLDSNADIIWAKTIGAYRRYDGGHSIIQSNDGCYYLAAYSQTFQSPDMDFDNWWLLKLNAAGDTLWTRWWGGPSNDAPHSIIPTSDGGIILAGWRDANSNPLYSLSIGNADFYVIKIDPRGMITGFRDVSSQPPALFDLYQNYPNPFNLTTTIRFSLPQRNYVTLKAFDVVGREVATLVSGELNPGEHAVDFNATDLASGVYFYKLQYGESVKTRKLLLMK